MKRLLALLLLSVTAGASYGAQTMTVTLNWSALCATITEHSIERSINGGAFGTLQSSSTDVTSNSAPESIVSSSVTIGQSFEYRVRYAFLSAPSVFLTNYTSLIDGGIYQRDATQPSPPISFIITSTTGSTNAGTVYFLCQGAAPPVDTCNLVICAKNNDTRYHVYCLWKNGVSHTATNNPGGLGIAAGATGCQQFTVLCSDSTGWSLAPCDGEYYDGRDGVTNYTVLTNSGTFTYPSTTNGYTPPGPTSFNPTNSTTGSNIVWTASANTNAILSQQQGDGALYDGITKFAAQNDKNLRDIKGALDGLGTNLNFTGETGVVGAVNAFHTDNTNVLWAIYDKLGTNMADGGEALTNLWFSTAPTIKTDVEGILQDLTEVGGTTEMPTTSDDWWTVNLFGTAVPGAGTINFRPSAALGDTAALMRRWVKWGLVIAFTIFVLKDIFELLKLIATTAQLDAPEAEATVLGVGGSIGWALAPLVIAVFLGAYAALLLAVSTSFTSVFSGEDFVTLISSKPWEGVTGAVAHGVAEGNAWLPLDFIGGSAIAYVGWVATKNLVASKFVFIMKMVIH